MSIGASTRMRRPLRSSASWSEALRSAWNAFLNPVSASPNASVTNRRDRILVQPQPRGVRHRQRSGEAHRVVQPEAGADGIRPFGHQDLAPVGGRVGGGEGGAVVGHAVAPGAEVAHIDPVHQLAVKDAGDVLDLDRFDAHRAAGRPAQVQAHVAIGRVLAPDHVDAGPRAQTDNRGDALHLSIGAQSRHRSRARQAGDRAAVGAGGIGGNGHVRKVPRQRLHPGRDTQVDARRHRCLPHVAQPDRRGVLEHLQAGTEILIRGHQRRVRRAGIGVAARGAVLGRPDAQPVGEGGRHQVQTGGDDLVHVAEALFPMAKTPLRPSGRAGSRADTCRGRAWRARSGPSTRWSRAEGLTQY